MNKIKKIYIKARRRLLQKINANKFKRLDSDVCIGMISSNEWKQRVYDDLLLQRAFLNAGMKAEIIAWQDNGVNFKKYDALLITSMWGYQKHLQSLQKWLDSVESLKVLNNVDIIRDNYDKEKQISILEKNKLPTIPTRVVDCSKLDAFNLLALNEYRTDFPIVVKPAISSGGDNTYVSKNIDELNNALRKIQRTGAKDKILLQPFIPEIENGEISVVIIDKKIVNAVIRLPGIIGKRKAYSAKAIEIADLEPDLIKLCKKIIALKDFGDCIYMRIDVIKRNDSYLIMEVELFEPQLFYYLLKGKERSAMLNAMVETVAKHLQ